jgi:hypothetical protein
MTVALQAPIASGDAIQLAGSRHLWRKQILKTGTIDYNGQRLTFDAKYCNDLSESFKAGAFDQVPFIFANGDGQHHEMPDRVKGDVKAIVPSADGSGVDAIFELSTDADQVVRDNPKLGVSCRILEGVGKAGRAVKHVLATLDPRIQGMSPWTAVELSAPGESVVDLTLATYEREAPVPELSEDEVALFRAMVADRQTAGAPTPPAPPTPTPPVTTGELDPEMEAMLKAIEADTGQLAGAGAPAELSAETRRALELAQTTENQRVTDLAAIQAELDEERFKRESAAYLAAGVPPKLVELSRPLLEGKRVVDLSNGGKVDAGTVVRSLLDECKGQIDLSGEKGFRVAGSNIPVDEATSARDMAAEYLKTYGGPR